jgi:hypothetical protein
MVQVQPTKTNRSILRAKRAGGNNEIALENRTENRFRETLPPARFARTINQRGLSCSLDINHPPTAVGGILTFVQSITD